MKIIFNPDYKEKPYVDYSKENGLRFNTIFANESKLLEILELRAGLTCHSPSAAEREADYLIALNDNVKESIFYESFKTDDWGVANLLLQWRDALILAGWNKDMTGISDKLDVLAKTENNFFTPSESDRWVNIAEYARNNNLLTDNDTIEVTSNKVLISPIVQNVLNHFGDKVKYINTEPLASDKNSNLFKLQKSLLENNPHEIEQKDNSLEIMTFNRKEEAYDWFVRSQANVDNDKNIVVNSDNSMLNSTLSRQVMPMVNSTIDNCNPQALQLFKLGLSLFERPLNAYNLLSYLQMPTHPINGKLRYELAKNLISNGGLDSNWYKTIEEFDFTDEDGKDKRKEQLAFLDPIYAHHNDEISINDIISYNSNMHKWVNRRMRADGLSENQREIMNALLAFFSAMDKTLNAHKTEGYISFDKLNKWIQNIYRPIAMKHEVAEVGATNIISNINLVYDAPEMLLWLDCNESNSIAYKYNFLNKTELDALKKKGVNIPTYEDLLKGARDNRNRAIAKVKNKLTLVTSATNLNEHLNENSLITELATKILNTSGTIDTPTIEKDIIKPQTENYYYLNENISVNREKESYSSIGTLIQHPFDYTMKYAAKVYESGNNDFDDIETTCGIVAHHVIESLFEKAEYNLATIKQKIEDEYDSLFDTAIMEKGIVLLQKENGLLIKDTKETLKKSIKTLINIIEVNKWTPEKCEAEIECNIDDIGNFEAKIDMLLTKDDQYIILDFKWSHSKSYADLLKENKSLQLALYEEAIKKDKGKDVIAKGYYLLPQCKLYTCDDIQGDGVEKIEQTDSRNLITMIQESYMYRKNELEQGIIEEADYANVELLKYHNDSEKLSLYPIKQKDNKKSAPYVSSRTKKKKPNYNQKEEDKSTTYTILKGRLK